jgi:hypothetical protein
MELDTMCFAPVKKFLAALAVSAVVVGCQSSSPKPVALVEPDHCTPAVQTAQFASTDCQAEARTVASRSRPVTREDIIAWTVRGTRDQIIIERITTSGSTFHLNTADEISLRDAGVSEDVVRVMKATAWN